MLNPIQKAIAEVKYSIPMEILQQAFVVQPFKHISGPNVARPVPVSIDHQIRQQVINPRVIEDCNLNGGVEINIPMLDLVPNNVSPYDVIYTIPKSLTQGRSIVGIKSMTVGQGSVRGTTNMGMTGASPMMDAAGSVLASALPIPLVSTAYVQLIGENTVLINDNMALPNNVWLRCIVEADSDFSHLQSRTYGRFAELVEYAVKAYIYNVLVIEVGMAQLVGGQELGKFKEILESYADANENYKTFLRDTWRVVALLDDPSQHQRHLRMINGGAW
jgi:hypothetical protein